MVDERFADRPVTAGIANVNSPSGLQMSEGFQQSFDIAVERFVGLNQILPCSITTFPAAIA